MKIRNTCGFTLSELLIFVVIFAIILAIAVPLLRNGGRTAYLQENAFKEEPVSELGEFEDWDILKLTMDLESGEFTFEVRKASGDYEGIVITVKVTQEVFREKMEE